MEGNKALNSLVPSRYRPLMGAANAKYAEGPGNREGNAWVLGWALNTYISTVSKQEGS